MTSTKESVLWWKHAVIDILKIYYLILILDSIFSYSLSMSDTQLGCASLTIVDYGPRWLWAMNLRISVYFHQIVPIRSRIKWYIFSMSITACFHHNTDSLVTSLTLPLRAKKSTKIKCSTTRYITMFVGSIQRLQICKISKHELGTLRILKDPWGSLQLILARSLRPEIFVKLLLLWTVVLILTKTIK